MKRVPELDGLRAIAVLMILVKHSNYGIQLHSRFVGMLILGVDLFFVLSGFLITQIILDNEDEPHFYRNFYVRRGLRIWPIYYFFLLGNAFFGLWGAVVPRIPWNELVRLFSFTQCLPFLDRMPMTAPAFEPTWSLAIEEQFYLIWPPLICHLRRKAAVGLALALVVLAVVTRVFTGQLLNIAARCDGLAVGGLLAVLITSSTRRPRLARRLVPGLMLGGLAFLTAPVVMRLLFRGFKTGLASDRWGRVLFSLDVLSFDLVMTCLIGLCVCRSGAMELAPLRIRPLRFVGKVSYAIYLYHTLVFHLLALVVGLAALSTLGGMALSFAVTIGVAAVSWTLIENPLLKLKARFEYHDEMPVAQATSPCPKIVQRIG
jgi:peptidoglycan/LPS O-acetylase OafA/YrhL